MSKEAHKYKVFQSTRMRTSLKNDGCWINKPKEEEEEEEKPRTDNSIETRLAAARQRSYVLSTAKKFESVDTPLSPPFKNTLFSPSKGDSANQANGDVIPPPQKDAQPEGSTLETTDDATLQAPAGELIQNSEAQPETSVTNTTAENKEEYIPVYQTHGEHSDGAAEVSAEVHVAECIQNGEAQPVSSTKENPEAVSPVEPTEQPVANTTAENTEEHADTVQSNIEHNETKVSADAAAADTEESKDAAAPAVELKPQEEPSTETEPANATPLEDAGIESAVQPAESSSENCPPEQAAEEVVETVAEVVAKSSPDTSDVVNATPGTDAVAEVAVVPENPAVTDATPGEEAALQDAVVPETPAVTAAAEEEAAPEPVPDLLVESVSELATPVASETATEESCEKGPPEQAAGESVEAVAEVAESPETPAVTGAAGEEAALQVSAEAVPDLVADAVSESPAAQTAAETAVKSVECKVESAASAEPEVVKCEVQPVDNTVVEQSVEPTPESAADRAVEDVVEPVKVSVAESVQETFPDRPIELTEAFNVEPSTTDAAPEPLKDPEQPHTEETEPNQHSDVTNISEIFLRSKEELQSTQTQYKTRNTKVCSFCDQVIDGNIKIYLSEPVMTCHPDCLKCGVCAKALGDLLTTMFLHNQMVQCGMCFEKAIKI